MTVTEEILKRHYACKYDFSQVFPWPNATPEADTRKSEELLVKGVSGGALGFNPRDVLLLLKTAEITGRREFAACASTFLLPVLKDADWRYPHHRHMSQVDLGMSVVCCKLAGIYEQLKGEGEQSELRAQIAHAVVGRGLNPFYAQVTDATKPGWVRMFMNWRSFIAGNMGLATKRVHGVYPRWRDCLAESIRNCLAVADVGGVDGGWEEGIGYWGMAFGQTVNLAEELLTASCGEVDLFLHPYFRVAGDFGLYCWMPGRKSVYAFSDWRVHEPRVDLMHSLACRWQNPNYQWCVERSSDPGFTIGRTAPKAEPPDALPKAKHFRGVDIAMLRTNWSDEAVAVGFKCGPRRIQTHHHLDANSFCLVDGADPVVDEVEDFEDSDNSPQVTKEDITTLYGLLGYAPHDEGDAGLGKASTCAHNSLLINGLGQLRGRNEWGQFKPTYRDKADTVLAHGEIVPMAKGARIVGFGDHGPWSYVIGEAASAYRAAVGSFCRTVILVHPCNVIVADRLTATAEVDACWLFHTGGIAEELDANRLRIMAGQSKWMLDAHDSGGASLKPQVLEWMLQDSRRRHVITWRDSSFSPFRWVLWHFRKGRTDAGDEAAVSVLSCDTGKLHAKVGDMDLAIYLDSPAVSLTMPAVEA